MNKERILEILDNFSKKKIILIGDIMLDEYIWGNVDRISPEAPVPVVDVDRESFHLGGAGNVAHNLKSMNAYVYSVGVTGNDNAADIVLEKFKKVGINSFGIFKDSNKMTTQKTRIIADNQHVVRIDKEKRIPISLEIENNIISYIKNLKDADAIIFEDYDKGLLNKRIIYEIIKIAKEKKIPVFVDPKFNNFYYYENTTLFKPNRKELSTATGIAGENIEELEEAAKKVIDKLNCHYLLLTLGSDGMLLFERDNEKYYKIPTKAEEVQDVSGAGDTVISALTLAYISGANIKEAAEIASFAAAAQLKKIGAQTVSIDEIIQDIKILI